MNLEQLKIIEEHFFEDAKLAEIVKRHNVAKLTATNDNAANIDGVIWYILIPISIL